MTSNKHMNGLTVYEIIGELADDLVAEAAVDDAFLPVPRMGRAGRAERRAERRAAKRAAREENPFVRFVNSGWGAAAISAAVSLLVLGGVVYAGRHAPGGSSNGPSIAGTSGSDYVVGATYSSETTEIPIEPDVPGYDVPTEPAPSVPAGPSAAMDALFPNTMPLYGGEVNFTVEVGLNLNGYLTAPTSLSVTLRATEPGVAIPYNNSWHVECLSDPAYEVPAMTQEIAFERAEPVRPDEYDSITMSTVVFFAPLPDGLYRVHNTRYDSESGRYVTAGWTEFAVGKAYSELLSELNAGATHAPDHEPLEGSPYTVTASVSKDTNGAARGISIRYRATAPGVSLWPNDRIQLVKLVGPDNPAGWGEVISSAEAIEALPPDADSYAIYNDILTLRNPVALGMGVYRVCVFSPDGYLIAYADFFWNGTEK